MTLLPVLALAMGTAPDVPWRTLRSMDLPPRIWRARSATYGIRNLVLDDSGRWLIYGGTPGGGIDSTNGKQVFLSLVRLNSQVDGAEVGYVTDRLSPTGRSYRLWDMPFNPLRALSATDFWLNTASGLNPILRRRELKDQIQIPTKFPRGIFQKTFDQDSYRMIAETRSPDGRTAFVLLEITPRVKILRRWTTDPGLPKDFYTGDRNAYSSRLNRLIAGSSGDWYDLRFVGNQIKGRPFPRVDEELQGAPQFVGPQGTVLWPVEIHLDTPITHTARLRHLAPDGKSWIDLGPRWLVATSGNGKYGLIANEHGAKTAEVVEFK
ncbi:MAG: hypothetical protein ACO1SV_25160 [Fimbriimonas sp.]